MTQTWLSRQIFKGFATSSNYNNVLQRLADRWCTTSAWNYYTGKVAAWGETYALQKTKGTWETRGDTNKHMARHVFSCDIYVHELYFVEVQKLKHMGHRYEERTTWVIAQTKKEFMLGVPAQLGQLQHISLINDQTYYVSITFYPDFVVDENWDCNNLLEVPESTLAEQWRADRSHTVTKPLEEFAVTPLRWIRNVWVEGRREMRFHATR